MASAGLYRRVLLCHTSPFGTSDRLGLAVAAGTRASEISGGATPIRGDARFLAIEPRGQKRRAFRADWLQHHLFSNGIAPEKLESILSAGEGTPESNWSRFCQAPTLLTPGLGTWALPGEEGLRSLSRNQVLSGRVLQATLR